ncbi:MAG TPA: DUF5060 domain-containing protein [Spirochaetota bacterium]|nr:DUF5060 domain-containing protein [Spirochaetota bacterium]
MKKIITLGLALAVISFSLQAGNFFTKLFGVPTDRESVLIDGFNKIGMWGAAPWENNAGEVSYSGKYSAEGQYAVKIKFEKSSQFHKAVAASEKDRDFSQIEYLLIDIYNKSDNFNKFTFAVTTGDSWEWHESKTFILQPGWNRNVMLPIKAWQWKAPRTDHFYRGKLKNAADVRRICFNFWGRGGTVFIDNLRAVGNNLESRKTPIPGPSEKWESFEDKPLSWSKAGWETRAVAAVRSGDYVSDGNASLRCDFAQVGKKGVATFSRDFSADWSKIAKLKVDVYNPSGASLKFNVALSTGGSWTWYESTARFLQTGWNKGIEFNLNAKNFKCEASGWAHTSYIKHKDKLRRLAFNVAGSGDKSISGTIYLDNIVLEKGEVLKIKREYKPKVYTKNYQDNDFDKPVIDSFDLNSDDVSLYDALKLDFTVDSFFNNPFDAEQIEANAVFISPDNKTLKVPAYVVKYDKEDQESVWQANFAPQKTGSYKAKIEVKTPGGTAASETLNFICTSSDKKGQIQVSGKNFVYANGENYIPIGFNIAWITANDDYVYADYISKLANNGGNWMRIWNATWGKNIIEWTKPHGEHMGVYNLEHCERIDEIVQQAERHDVKISFVIHYHDMFVADGEWELNPYSKFQGGPCEEPIDFFKNPVAKKYFKNKLRYIIGRWSASEAILSWELWNEVDLVSGFDEEIVARWHKEMAAFIKTIDPHKHPVTTSFCRATAGEKTWTLPEIDYTHTHLYSDDLLHNIPKICAYKSKFDKPHIVGEAGGADTSAGTEAKDKEGIRFKEALFAGLLSPKGSGTAMYWWWDSLIKPYDLFRKVDGVAFLAEDMDKKKDKLVKAKVTIKTKNFGDISFAPALDWEASLGNSIKITAQGDVEGKLFSKYLQGDQHKAKMGGAKTISVNCPRQSELSLWVEKAARTGAKLVITVDGQNDLQKSFAPNAAGDTPVRKFFKVKLDAGSHKIKIDNRGQDWLQLGSIIIKDVAPAIMVKGLANKEKGFYWIKNRDYTAENYLKGKMPAAINNASVELEGYNNGSYSVQIYNSHENKIVAEKTISASQGKLRLNLPVFTRDLLVKVK